MNHSTWKYPKAHGEHTAFGKTKRRNFPIHLAKCDAFSGHSMRAEWEDGRYVVYSYDQPIAEYDPSDGTVHINEYQYTPKTTEHQNVTNAWLAKDFRNENGTYGIQYYIMWPEEMVR